MELKEWSVQHLSHNPEVWININPAHDLLTFDEMQSEVKRLQSADPLHLYRGRNVANNLTSEDFRLSLV
jgi:hypothetical protein